MDASGKYKSIIDKQVTSIEWIRDSLLEMDELANPVLGINAWDDAVVYELGGRKIVASIDGPYKKRLVLKSALIHAATDVVVKGGKPLFALEALSGNGEDIKEMLAALKKQALEMRIPILGGNTMVGEGDASATLTVFGELVLDNPIRDSGAIKGDVLLVIGEPVWGGMDERIGKAKTLFKAWYSILDCGIKINSSKDVTKGGLISAVYEICTKSGVEYVLEKEVPFSLTRNLDNFLVSVSEKDELKILEICAKARCPQARIGRII
jgi:selenophosphate synthetase-related protein